MSVEALRWAKTQRPKTATQRAVLMAVAEYANDQGLGWPSQKTLADDMLLTDRTIRTALAGLEADGFLVRISKRNADGTRGVDRIQLCLTDELRERALARIQRKRFPVVQPAENNDQTTGKFFQNHRKLATQPPEAASAQEPSLGETPVGIPHKQNVSEAIASGGDAAPRQLSEIDLCWMEARPNLQACGMSAKDAGALIGTLLRNGHSHSDIRAASYACVEIGTGDPIRYMQGVLRKTAGRERPDARRKSSAATRLLDRVESRHGTARNRGGAGSSPVIEHESDERPRGHLH